MASRHPWATRDIQDGVQDGRRNIQNRVIKFKISVLAIPIGLNHIIMACYDRLYIIRHNHVIIAILDSIWRPKWPPQYIK